MAARAGGTFAMASLATRCPSRLPSPPGKEEVFDREESRLDNESQYTEASDRGPTHHQKEARMAGGGNRVKAQDPEFSNVGSSPGSDTFKLYDTETVLLSAECV